MADLLPVQAPLVCPQRNVLLPIYLEAGTEDRAGGIRFRVLIVVANDGLDFVWVELHEDDKRARSASCHGPQKCVYFERRSSQLCHTVKPGDDAQTLVPSLLMMAPLSTVRDPTRLRPRDG